MQMYPIFPIYYNALLLICKNKLFLNIPYSNEKTAIQGSCPKRAVCESNADKVWTDFGENRTGLWNRQAGENTR